jgi:hypothetical protein
LSRRWKRSSRTCDAVLQEFGTLPKPHMLKALREENRCHHWAGGGIDHPAKRRATNAFNPPWGWWRRRVLRLGQERLAQCLASLDCE